MFVFENDSYLEVGEAPVLGAFEEVGAAVGPREGGVEVVGQAGEVGRDEPRIAGRHLVGKIVAQMSSLPPTLSIRLFLFNKRMNSFFFLFDLSCTICYSSNLG